MSKELNLRYRNKPSILFVLLLIVLSIILLNSCSKSDAEEWYRTSYEAAQMNVITISKYTDKGFQLSAQCINGANSGSFEGWFSFVTDTKAVYSSVSDKGVSYKIFVEFENKNMKVECKSEEIYSEWDLLGFGNVVTISGEYSKEKPNYDYSDLVIEKVFMSDVQLAESVKQYLGDSEYNTFVMDFGMSNYIYEKNNNGYIVTKGALRGIGDWCAFCSDSTGYFYGVYNDVYFTNDPIYKDSEPDFLR